MDPEDEGPPPMPIPPLPVYDPQRRQLVCMIDTDTRENVDPKLFYDKLEELEGVRILEKSEVCTWFAGLEQPQSAALREQLDTRSDHALDGDLVAAALAHRLAAIHREIVKEKTEDLQDLAAAWQAVGDPTAPLPTVPQDQLYILLRGFPLTLDHLESLRAVGLPLHLVLCVNSRVPLAAPAEEKVESTPKKKDQKSRDSKKDPKAKGGKDEKKQEPKKGKDAKGGRKGKVDEEDEPPAPTLTLSQQLRAAEVELAGAWVQSHVRDVLLVQHDMKVEQDEPEEEGGPPALYLVELEDEAAEALYRHMAVTAARRQEYDAWVAGQTVTAVPTLEQTRKVEKLRAELQAKEEEIAKVEESIRETWELMQTRGGKVEKGGRKPPAETPGTEGKPASRDIKSVKKDKATLEREREMEAQQAVLNALVEERDRLLGHLQAQPPMTPSTLEVDQEYYQTLLNGVADPWLTLPVVLHCMVEQVAKTVEAERPVEVLDVAVEALQTTVGTVGTLRSAASDPGAEGPLTLRLNATAAEAEPPGPDATLALGDYLDAALARLGGTADRVVQAVVELNRGEDAPDGPPSEADPAKDAAVVDFGDEAVLPRGGLAEPLVAGVRVRDIAIRMLEAVAALPRFRRILQPAADPPAPPAGAATAVTTMAGPTPAEEDPEVVQLAAEIRMRLTQAQAEREFLLAEFEALLDRARGGAGPPADLAGRTLFEPIQRLTLLQRLMDAFEEPELKVSVQPRPHQQGAQLCALHREVPPCRFLWGRQVAEFTGLTYFPEWLGWYQRLQAEGQLPSDDAPPAPVSPGAAHPDDQEGPPTFAELLLKKAPPPDSFDNADQWRHQATLAELGQKLRRGGPRQLYRIQASGPINPVLRQETTTLFPADGALLRVTTSETNSRTVSCTVLHGDVRLGLHCSLPPPEPPPAVLDPCPAPVLDAAVTLRVPELAGVGGPEAEDYPWGQLLPHGLHCAAHFADGSTFGIQAQMVYPSAMEAYDAEALAPMLLTVADYSCGSGLLVTQLSSGEVLQTYCGGLAEPPVPEDEEDVGLGTMLEEEDPLAVTRRSNSAALAVPPPEREKEKDKDREKEFKTTAPKSTGKGPVEPPATYQEPLRPEGLPPLQDVFKMAVPVNGAFPAAEGAGPGLPPVRSARDSHVLGPLGLVHVWDRLRQSVEPLLACELRRKVVGKATVIRYLQGGAIQILLADGGTSTFHHGAWLVTHVSGRRTVTARGEAFEAPPLLCATNMDAETRALVTTREDLVMVIRGPDGSRLAQHADGTRIWTAADGVSFRIEAPRFAPVELHRGPGGPGRTVVHLLDGAVLRCVPGQEFALLRPDDNYFRVDLQQHLLYFEPLTAGIPPGGLEAYGVYQCNYIRGGLRTMDREGHAYRVTLHGECATQLADPTAANHPIVDAVDPDVDSDVERLWGLPRGTLRAVHRGAPWPMPTLAADRVARPPAPPPAARLPAPPSAAAIVGDSLAARKVAGGQALHRPRLFLVHADGSATQLHTAADVLPFLAAAVQAAPATAVEHHPVAGQPGLHAVTVLARYRPPGDRDLNVLDAVVPRSVASVYHRGTQLWQTRGFESLAASHLATLQLSRFLSAVAAQANTAPPGAGPAAGLPFMKRSFLRYPQLDPVARRALRWAVQRAAAEVQEKASTVAALQARDDRSTADKALQAAVQEQLLALIAQKEQELQARQSAAEPAEPEPAAAPSAAAPPKAARPAKPRASPLAARQATLQQMRAGGGHANYWQSAEGRTAHAALPAYTPPPAKPRPPPPTTTTLADLERQGSADSSAAAPPTPAAPSDGGSSPLFHTQPAGASPAPKPIKPAGPRTGYGAGPAGAAPAVGPSKPKDVYGRVREGGVPVKALKSDFAASEPNAAYLQREAGQQRTSKTASTAPAAQRGGGGPAPASPSSLGGSLSGVILDPLATAPQDRLVATPSRLNFGNVCEGYVYGMDFTLTNLGHVPCRFHLKLPRGDLVACDWAKGPIAPGMTIKVSVQLAAAVAAGQDINETIVVSAESSLIHLPVTASIRPSSEGGKAPPSRTVRVLSNARLPAVKRPMS